MKRLAFLAPVLLAGCVIYQRPSGWIPARVPLTAERIAEMKSNGESDASIRKELAFHGLDHKLSADELVILKDAGAGDALLKDAAEAPVKEPAEARPVYERRTYYHDPYWDRDYYYTYTRPWFFLTTGLSFNYHFGHRCR